MAERTGGCWQGWGPHTYPLRSVTLFNAYRHCRRLRAVACAPDLLDVLEAALYDTAPEPTAPTATTAAAGGGVNSAAEVQVVGRELAGVLMQLAFELLLPAAAAGGSGVGSGGGGGVQEVVGAMVRLQGLCPDVWAPHAAALALLSMATACPKVRAGLESCVRVP